jgi:RNA polymerase sigma-70 factor (ECF subfamily)
MLAQLPTLRAFAFSLCSNFDRADDLVQETVLKAWQHLDKFEEGTNLRAWLFTILRNSYFSELRKKRREVEDVDGKMTESLSVAPAQQGHLDMQDFRKALSTLPADQREALVLVGAVGRTDLPLWPIKYRSHDLGSAPTGRQSMPGEDLISERWDADG